MHCRQGLIPVPQSAKTPTHSISRRLTLRSRRLTLSHADSPCDRADSLCLTQTHPAITQTYSASCRVNLCGSIEKGHWYQRAKTIDVSAQVESAMLESGQGKTGARVRNGHCPARPSIPNAARPRHPGPHRRGGSLTRAAPASQQTRSLAASRNVAAGPAESARRTVPRSDPLGKLSPPLPLGSARTLRRSAQSRESPVTVCAVVC